MKTLEAIVGNTIKFRHSDALTFMLGLVWARLDNKIVFIEEHGSIFIRWVSWPAGMVSGNI